MDYNVFMVNKMMTIFLHLPGLIHIDFYHVFMHSILLIEYHFGRIFILNYLSLIYPFDKGSQSNFSVLRHLATLQLPDVLFEGIVICDEETFTFFALSILGEFDSAHKGPYQLSLYDFFCSDECLK